MDKKILEQKVLLKKIQSLRKKNKKIVFTNGCFDILHAGHVQYLKKAKSFGDVLIIGLNSDSSVRKIKGTGRPINREEDRAFLLAALEAVDLVVIFKETTPLNLIKKIKPDFLVKGADWKENDIAGKDVVVSCGGQIKRVAFKKGYSTSKVISLIKGNSK